MSKQQFPMKGKYLDEDKELTDEEKATLEKTQPGLVLPSLFKPAGIITQPQTGPALCFVPVPSWIPSGSKTPILQTEADPKTGKRLLMD